MRYLKMALELVESEEVAAAVRLRLAELYYLSAKRHLAAKDRQRAIEYFVESIKFLPDHAPTHYELALVYLQQGKSKEAEKHLRRALELDPKNTRTLDRLKRLRDG